MFRTAGSRDRFLTAIHESDLADILRFQFHRSLAEIAGCKEPLNRCSIYGNKAAGARLNAMLEMGASRDCQTTLRMEDREDNGNNRFAVAADLNRKLTGGAAPFWGCPAGHAGPYLTTTKPAMALPERATERRGAKPP